MVANAVPTMQPMRVTKISSEGLAFEAGPSWRALPFCAAWLAIIWLVDKNFTGERTFSYYWVALTFSLAGVAGVFGSLQYKTLSLDPELKKVLWHRKTLLGIRRQEYSLPDLKVAKYSKGETEDGSSFLLHLYFHTSSPAYLHLALNGAEERKEKQHIEITTTINTWLANHAPVDSTPPQA